MIISKAIQGTEEWFCTRLGIPSASRFDQLITAKGDPSKSRTKLLYTLAGERVMKRREETYQSPAMARGIELEPQARMVFEMLHDIQVDQTGFCFFDNRMDRGCSPDGLIPSIQTGLEIKCPSLPVHIEYLLGEKLPDAYYQQVHGSMYVTGYNHWYFMSYYPDMPPFIIRVEHDINFSNKLGTQLDNFCSELSALTQKLTAMLP